MSDGHGIGFNCAPMVWFQWILFRGGQFLFDDFASLGSQIHFDENLASIFLKSRWKIRREVEETLGAIWSLQVEKGELFHVFAVALLLLELRALGLISRYYIHVS